METKYKTTIGLEIHAELKTQTKMFCNSKNDPDEKRPNVNVCPICMGHPGTLPTLNKEAIKHVLKMGIAVNGNLADFTEFDRKNYFYPDIPKGYQISQYKYPLVSGGELNGVKLTRIHLEEDTASSSHEDKTHSIVDFNRAGVPLMELVTEPVIHSAEEASAFAKELQLLLQYLGAGEANMEKGEMRVEANISVSATKDFGTKVEVKNLNSFKSVEKAIAFEVARHIELLESGEKVVQETRGWDEDKQITFSQRLKEYSHDYRYFPDPDLPKLKLSEVPEFAKDVLKKELPLLPWEIRELFKKKYKGMSSEEIEWVVNDKEVSDIVMDAKNDQEGMFVIRLFKNDLVALQKENPGSQTKGKIKNVSSLDKLARMFFTHKLSSRGVKDVLKIMFETGREPEEIAQTENLLQKSDEGALKVIVQKIIDANPSVVADYKAGKQTALQFLIGQGMKESKGSANPQILKEIFTALLK